MREWELVGDVQGEIEEMSGRIREVLEKTEEKGKGRRRKRREWWDQECRRKKGR